MPKKRQHGEGGLYFSQSKNLWIGRVDDGFHPDGRRRQREVTSTKKEIAIGKLRRLQAQIDAGETPASRMTFAQWVEEWWKAGPDLSPHAERDYRSTLKVHILPVIGKIPLKEIQPNDIKRVRNEIYRRKLGYDTALKAHRVMGSIWTDAIINQKVKRDIFTLAKMPKRPEGSVSNPKRRAFTPDQAIAVLDAAMAREDYARWLLGFIYGARPAEVFGCVLENLEPDLTGLTLEWSVTEANFTHGCGADGGQPTCGYARTGNCPDKEYKLPAGFEYRPLSGRFLLKRPKNGATRYVTLIEPVALAVQEQLGRLESLPNPDGLLFPMSNGWPRFHKADNEAWQDIMLSAGVLTPEQLADPKKRPTPYWMRHSSVTLMRRLGVPDTTIGAIVGHSASRVTDIYDDQLDLRGRAEAAEKLGASLSR
ncbi:tyrosine-type recombinase/integrase [Leifsonia sp. NPDC056665]|uniref:tyrosine-type recombinase/integrase n=1 Tax=Leifsonia sp. NPDC056665 TaxID=3345901 RepID=UPI0036A56C0D